MILASLSDAIDWARSRWDEQRVAPVRLHEARSVDGELGGPNFSHAMERTLDGRPTDLSWVSMTVSCTHLRHAIGQPLSACPDCFGQGVKDHYVIRYRYPMTLALTRLQNSLPIRRSYPHPYVAIVTLAEHGWNARAAASSMELGWDMAEAHLLRSLRMLNGRYEEGPVNTRTSAGSMRGSWVDMSESAQNAIIAGETNAA